MNDITIARHPFHRCLVSFWFLLIAAPGYATAATFTVDRLTDTGAGSGFAGDLNYCMTNAQNGDTITFGVKGTINLLMSLPNLTRSISIQNRSPAELTVQ